MSNIEAETTTDSAQATAAPTASLDATRVPDSAWLDEVEGELEDVDLVLKCLARDSSKICSTCAEATTTGNLEQRPVLARCASTKTTS